MTAYERQGRQRSGSGSPPRAARAAPDAHVAGEEHVAIAERAHGDVRRPSTGRSPVWRGAVARASSASASGSSRSSPAATSPATSTRAAPRARGNGKPPGSASASDIASEVRRVPGPAGRAPSARPPPTPAAPRSRGRPARSRPSRPARGARAACHERREQRVGPEHRLDRASGRRPRRTGGPPARAASSASAASSRSSSTRTPDALGSHGEVPAAVLQGDTATIGTALDLLHAPPPPSPPGSPAGTRRRTARSPVSTRRHAHRNTPTRTERRWAERREVRRATAAASADPLLLDAADQLRAYFAGELREFDLPLAPSGTEFQRQVWAAVSGDPVRGHRGLLGDRRRGRTPQRLPRRGRRQRPQPASRDRPVPPGRSAPRARSPATAAGSTASAPSSTWSARRVRVCSHGRERPAVDSVVRVAGARRPPPDRPARRRDRRGRGHRPRAPGRVRLRVLRDRAGRRRGAARRRPHRRSRPGRLPRRDGDREQGGTQRDGHDDGRLEGDRHDRAGVPLGRRAATPTSRARSRPPSRNAARPS